MDAVSLYYARLVFSGVQSIYDLHRDLCRAFDGPRGETYLFRTDVVREKRPARRVVLVQSRKPGQWDLLASKLEDCKHGLEPKVWRIQNGEKFRYFLRANATRRKKASLKEMATVRGEEFRKLRGKKTAIHGDAQLEAWLRRQGETHGFRLVENRIGMGADASCPVAALRIFSGRDARWSKAETIAKHAGVDFEGLLDVVDSGKLANAVANGIGPGKAFGFGLLSLARPS